MSTTSFRERVLVGLLAAGWEAAVVENGVVVRYQGEAWRVAGGTNERPSLLRTNLDVNRIAWRRPALGVTRGR